ncbi:MAG: MFS transporter [Anaerolineae bacterium]
MSKLLSSFPRAFWVLLVLYFFNRIASSFIWPFISLFAVEQTGEPLAHVTPLLSLQAVTSLLGTSVISALMDRFGRKKAMILGMVVYAGVLLGMSGSTHLWQWALLIVLYGISQPMFMVGANAMVADLVVEEKRTDAYAILRTIANVTIAIGPAISGLLITHSPLLAYYTTAAISLLLVVPSYLFLQETLARPGDSSPQSGAGFTAILRDTRFVVFCGVYAVLEIGIAMVFSLLGVYVKENFNILENEYGLLLSVNALMVVFFQYAMTRLTKRFPPFTVLAVGALFYMAGLLTFGTSSLLLHFALGMAVLTTGELLVAPTATAQVANMAPPDKRARYMGIYSLLYSIGAGIGPSIGGVLSGSIAPSAIWYGAALATLLAAVGFALMPRLWRTKQPVEEDIAVVEIS